MPKIDPNSDWTQTLEIERYLGLYIPAKNLEWNRHSCCGMASGTNAIHSGMCVSAHKADVKYQMLLGFFIDGLNLS